MKYKSIINIIIMIIAFTAVTSCSFIEEIILLIKLRDEHSALQEPSLQEVFQFYDGTINAYGGSEKTLVIPSEINGEAVTAIGAYAIKHKKVDSIIIPDSVIEIGRYAFTGIQLKSVTIGNGVTTIGDNAFANNKLESIIIPDSVTYIGWEVFKNNKLKSVTIGKSVEIIGLGAFADNKLESITIGDNVETGYFHTRLRIRPTAPFDDGFFNAYEEGGKKAGTYTLDNRVWTKQ